MTLTDHPYSTLAAGFLTAKFINNQHAGTRFDDKNPLGKFAQNAFADETVQNALKTFDTKVKAAGLTCTEVALRMVVHQLALEDNDAVILGASKMGQIEETVRMIRRGPLPGEVVVLAGELCDQVKGVRGEMI